MKTEKKTKTVKITVNSSDQMLLSAVAIHQLEKAKKEEDGHRFRGILPSMAFSTFSVEALCNLYGQELFEKNWKHFESMSFVGKVILISESLGISVDLSVEPWQTINEMKNFRNELVHTKPLKATRTHENVPEDFPNRLLPYPESKSIANKTSVKTAEKFYEISSRLEMMWFHAISRNEQKNDCRGLIGYSVNHEQI